jgi:hypothetical protein
VAEKRRVGSVRELVVKRVGSLRPWFGSGLLHVRRGFVDVQFHAWHGMGGFRRDAEFLPILARTGLYIVGPVGRGKFALDKIRGRFCFGLTLLDNLRHTINLLGYIMVIPRPLGLNWFRCIHRFGLAWR